jgi:dihydroxyacid dehydratase/phosphogluconate dehydratase
MVGPLKESIEKAGGIAVEFPGHVTRRRLDEAFLDALSQPRRDGARRVAPQSATRRIIVLAACDKSVPGALMGAFSTNLPTLLMVSGPRPVAHFEGRRIGTGTDLWRLWDQRRAGNSPTSAGPNSSGRSLLEKEPATPWGPPHHGRSAETLGLAWPGSTSIPAGDGRHLHIAPASGRAGGGLALTETPNSRRRSPRRPSRTLSWCSARSAVPPTPSFT